MKIKSILLGLFVFALAAGSQAQTNTPQISKRQKTQQKRIHKGAKDGDLTKKEVYRLEKQQRRINRSKKRAQADGVVTTKERAKIHKQQNHASRHIAHRKGKGYKMPKAATR